MEKSLQFCAILQGHLNSAYLEFGSIAMGAMAPAPEIGTPWPGGRSPVQRGSIQNPLTCLRLGLVSEARAERLSSSSLQALNPLQKPNASLGFMQGLKQPAWPSVVYTCFHHRYCVFCGIPPEMGKQKTSLAYPELKRSEAPWWGGWGGYQPTLQQWAIVVGCMKEREQEGAARGGLLLHSHLCAFYLVTQREKGKKK